MAIIFNIDEAVKNSKFNVLQEPIQMILENETEAFEKESFIPKVFVMKTTDKYREEFRSTTAMDGFKPTEDMEPAGLSDFQESYSKQFVFQTWTNGFVVSKQTIEDNQDASIEPKALGFIKSYGRTREIYAANIIGAALGKDYTPYKIKGAKQGTGMDTVDGDIDSAKQQYFHNAHKGVKIDGVSKVTQSNKFYATLDWTGADPELEEKLIDVIGQVASKMKTYKDDKGNIIPCKPTKILIAEDFRLQDVLERALRAKYGSRMDGNGVTLFGNYEVIVSPYLTEVDGFKADQATETDNDHAIVLIDPERNREGLGAVWFDRIPLSIDSYIDNRTKANFWDGRARFAAGFGDFRAMAYINLNGGETTNATQITPKATAVKSVKVTNTVKTEDATA